MPNIDAVVALIRGLPNEKFKAILDSAAIVRKLLDEVEALALRSSPERLREIGYTTKRKFGRRRWTEPLAEVKRRLITAGVAECDIRNENGNFVTPSQAEKLLPNSGVVAGISEVPESGFQLVKVTDATASFEDLFR